MTEADIDKALEHIFSNKALKDKLGLDKQKVYNLRNRNNIEQKLKVLFDANYLVLNHELTRTT